MAGPVLICLIGAECSGKTTLAQALASHFGGLWVPEPLRNFCVKHGRPPVAGEQLALIQTQLQAENKVLRQDQSEQAGIVFCDSAPLLTAIYSEYYFSDLSLYESARALHARYRMTLFLDSDLPWQADGYQRDGPVVRDQIHQIIKRELCLQNNVVAISGMGSSRLQAAIDALSCNGAQWGRA